jgi:hypothetical protein
MSTRTIVSAGRSSSSASTSSMPANAWSNSASLMTSGGAIRKTGIEEDGHGVGSAASAPTGLGQGEDPLVAGLLGSCRHRKLDA